jgi:small-conductance mechanosensitive channel
MFRTTALVSRCRLFPWLLTRLLVFAVLLPTAPCPPARAGDTLATNPPPPESNSTLTLANRRICTFRSLLDGYSPEERAAAAAARLHSVMEHAKTMLVSTQTVPAGIQITLDGKALFVVTPEDVFNIRGQTLDSKAADVAAALRSALKELHSFSTPGEVIRAIAEALLGLVVFAALLWGIPRAKRWVLSHLTKLVSEKTKEVDLRGLRNIGLRSFVLVLRALLNFTAYLLIALLAYALLSYELRRFPYSRPWGDFLLSQGFDVLASIGDEVMAAIPEVLVVVLVVLAARLVVQVLSRLFAAVEKGEIQTQRLDTETSATTRRLLILLVWIVAIVVAYPYIPGSQSLAFKGVTVFAGLVVSLGSSNVVNQSASGLLLIYSRTFRVGDYVRVGETEGTVVDVGICVTRIRTVKNELVQIANSVLLASATMNYSRLAESEGLLLPAKVTIGYSTPWRQVHAMLLEAANRTPGLLGEPPPFVLQTSLSDFYAEYELNVRLERPERRVWVQSELHGHIQDVFNEHGVQIMSPHYFKDPPQPHVVPKSKWFLPPATAEPDGDTQQADKSPSPATPRSTGTST